eukprot:Sspe_Gene.49154::Locus_26188_Transcript_1_1_Confidence_1.000_Length_1644::g.49154::m.49154/K00453/TDO2, kynA; tryptophan 2,3-dioxygenase
MSCPMKAAEDKEKESEKFSILGFETEIKKGGVCPFTNIRTVNDKGDRLTNYTDYINVEKLLSLQEGESTVKPDGKGMMHHEELLFIVTHQAIELWFKVLLADLRKVRDLMQSIWREGGSDEEGRMRSWKNMQLVGHYLRRATMIWHHASSTFAVLQTMHPADFLEFRDFLVPASGFQSFQFREIEILMGLDETSRVPCNNQHVFTALTKEQQELLKEENAKEPSIKQVLEELLLHVMVPDNFMDEFYKSTEKLAHLRQHNIAHLDPADSKELALKQVKTVRDFLEHPLEHLPKDDPRQERQRKCLQAAAYVSCYRTEPQFSAMSEMLDELIACEEGLLLFRARHLHNVERVIGRRIGTGGSSGVAYLEKTREIRIFEVLWSLRRIFLRSSILPSFDELHGNRTSKDLFLFKEETPM